MFTVRGPERLDAFLAAQQSIISRAVAQRLIRTACVTVNGVVVTKRALMLKPGDIVCVTQTEEAPLREDIVPTDLKLPVLYEDAACLVLDKPAGLAVHPAPSIPPTERTLLHGIAFLFSQRSIPFAPDAVLVHRLDRETTGCILVAKTKEAHHALQKQFEERSVKKTYVALVAGVPNPPSALIDAPVGRNLLERVKMSILRTSTSREARTAYRTLSSSRDCALLACDLFTGRTHQIRVHLSAIGHPILGDPTYASVGSERLSTDLHVVSLCLHARELTFTSPVGDVRHTIIAPLPEALTKAMRTAGVQMSV